MADTKISGLPAASAADGTEVTPVVQSATTKKMTVDQIKAYISAYTNGSSLAGRKVWTQTSDPAASATDGDLWFVI